MFLKMFGMSGLTEVFLIGLNCILISSPINDLDGINNLNLGSNL